MALGAASLCWAQSAETTTYQGVLQKDGTPFNGNADYKFVIVSEEGSKTLWSNDGTSEAGSEPESSVVVPVDQGLFSVLLGGPPMDPLGADLVNQSEDAALRVWVRTPGTGFEQLSDQEFASNPFSLHSGTANGAPGDFHASGGISSGETIKVCGGGFGNPGRYISSDGQMELYVDHPNGFPVCPANPAGAGADRALRLERGGVTAANVNVIGGHMGNNVSAGLDGATIGGGGTAVNPNRVAGHFGTVGGGQGNEAGNVNASSDTYATVGGGTENFARAYGDVIAGGWSNATNIPTPGAGHCTIAGGIGNTVDGTGSSVGGGQINSVTGDSSTIGGGVHNVITADNATIAGGGDTPGNTGNRITDDFGAIGGGGDNQAGDAGAPTDAPFATVSGGESNNAAKSHSAIGGGIGNLADADGATIGGGVFNSVLDEHGTVGGGSGNVSDGHAATVAGGDGNMALAEFAAIGGGAGNNVTDDFGTVGGGSSNQAGDANGIPGDATFATVGGGNTNVAAGIGDVVCGGWENTTSGGHATIAGGVGNTANGTEATVCGGGANSATDYSATVGGGESNVASGYGATVPGGNQNEASGSFSFAAGQRAKANHDGTFVWADSSTNTNFASTAANQFRIRAAGGLVLDSSTNPGRTLQITSTNVQAIRATNDLYTYSGGSALFVVGTTAVGNFLIASQNDQNKIFSVIGATGYVGIGTPGPQAKLHVVGDVYVDGNICATGSITGIVSVGPGPCSPSDARFKKNVAPLANALDKLGQLRGVSYDWRRDEFPDHKFTDARQIGFIAQEVEAVMPEVVVKGNDGYLAVDYGRITPLLVEATKEQQRQIEAIQAENAALKSELAQIKLLIEAQAERSEATGTK